MIAEIVSRSYLSFKESMQASKSDQAKTSESQGIMKLKKKNR